SCWWHWLPASCPPGAPRASSPCACCGRSERDRGRVVMSNIVEAAARDLRHALRRLARNAGFTTAAVLTLALGIGGTTAIFSVVNGVLLRPLPYPQPEEVMQIRHVDASGNSQLNVSFPN